MAKKCKLTLLFIIIFFIPLTIVGYKFLWQFRSEVPVDKRPVLRIGAAPIERIEKTQDQLQPFVKYFEKKIGLKVQLIVTSNYQELINLMRQGEVDVALLGPFSYIMAHREANAQVFAGAENSKSGKVYYSVIIVDPQSGIENIQQLKGSRMAFTDPASTSGCLIPKALLLKNGISPDKDMTVTYKGHHDDAILAVKKKIVDAAAVSSVILQNLHDKGVVGDKDYRVIYTSDPIPSNVVWAYRGGMPAELLAQMKKAFFGANDDKDALGSFRDEIGTFFPISDDEFDIIRETSRYLGTDSIE